MNKTEKEGQMGQVLAGNSYHGEGKGKTGTTFNWHLNCCTWSCAKIQDTLNWILPYDADIEYLEKQDRTNN